MNLKYSLFSLMFIVGCTSTSVKNPKVNVSGALKNIMHKGDLSAKANVNELKGKPNVYALGAIENLKGEILIWDSKPLISSIKEDQLALDNGFNHQATLLVWSTVKEWKSFPLADSVKTKRSLENHIANLAQNHGLNIDEPFPFLLEGPVDSLAWHVINWKDGDKDQNHYKHKTSGLQGVVKGQPIKILGFYSTKHHAIFTHHTTNMHMHFKSDDGLTTGHVDGLELSPNMMLKFPL